MAKVPTSKTKSKKAPSVKRSHSAKSVSRKTSAAPKQSKKPLAQSAPKGAKAVNAKPARTRKTNTAAPPPMFKKVAFTMFSVSDPTRARAFYEQTLGFKRGLASPNGSWTEYDLPSGGCLALFCHPNPDFRGQPGGASIAFEVADLNALNERLRAAGVEYLGDVIHGPNCRMSNIKDSEGNGIILHQLNGK